MEGTISGPQPMLPACLVENRIGAKQALESFCCEAALVVTKEYLGLGSPVLTSRQPG